MPDQISKVAWRGTRPQVLHKTSFFLGRLRNKKKWESVGKNSHELFDSRVFCQYQRAKMAFSPAQFSTPAFCKFGLWSDLKWRQSPRSTADVRKPSDSDCLGKDLDLEADWSESSTCVPPYLLEMGGSPSLSPTIARLPPGCHVPSDKTTALQCLA